MGDVYRTSNFFLYFQPQVWDLEKFQARPPPPQGQNWDLGSELSLTAEEATSQGWTREKFPARHTRLCFLPCTPNASRVKVQSVFPAGQKKKKKIEQTMDGHDHTFRFLFQYCCSLHGPKANNSRGFGRHFHNQLPWSLPSHRQSAGQPQ